MMTRASPQQSGLTVGGLDLPSLVVGVTGWPYDECRRSRYPEEWLGGHLHSHRAIDDALGYAALLTTMIDRRRTE